MTCETAMITDVITVPADITVKEALEILRQHQIRSAPVIDENRQLLGVFSFSIVIKNLLPISVTMDEGLDNLDFVVGTSPGVAKRLAKLKNKTVESTMIKNPVVVYPDTSNWETIRLMVKYGSPLAVVEENSSRLLGVLTEQAALSDLERIFNEMELDKEINDPDKEE